MVSPLLKRYLIALDRHKWAGLAGFGMVMGLSAVVAIQPQPPANYKAEGMLTYAAPPVTLSETGIVLQQQGQALTPEILLSDAVVSSVVQQLRAERIATTTAEILERSEVVVQGSGEQRSPTPNAQPAPINLQITLTYRHPNEQVARKTTQVLMEAMVTQSRQFNSQQLNSILDNLNKLLPKVTQELRAAEENLERYQRAEGPALRSAQDGQLVEAINNSRAQQQQIRLTLEGMEAQIASLESRLGQSADQAYLSAALSADPIIADLRAKLYQVQTQLQLSSQTLRADHPTMIELRNQQQVFEQLLEQRVGEVTGGRPALSNGSILQGSSLDPARQQLANTLVQLQTQRETLRQQLASLSSLEQQLRQEYATLPNKLTEQARLEQQVRLKQSFYDRLQARLSDTQLAAEETVGSLVIAQPPQVALMENTGRNDSMILLLGCLAGLLVGGGLVLLLDTLDSMFHTLQDLQIALRQKDVPILGLLPDLPMLQSEELPILLEPNSPYLEPYERLRVNLRRLAGGRALKVLVFTSAIQGEGKTTTAYNLAIASARAGRRTLLIEGNLRSPSQSFVVNVDPDPNSLLEPLRYYGRAEFTLVPGVENLYLLPAAGPQRQAAALLESSEMRRILEDVRGRFDLTIVDTPALGSYNDALLLEPHTDGILLITRPNCTEETPLAEALEQLAAAEDVQFLGAIINGGERRMTGGYVGEEEPEPLLLIEREMQRARGDRLGTGSRNR